MKLREWNARLHGLVVFRSLLDDPVVAKLLDLTDRMEAGAPGYGPVCDAVAQFEAALFEHTTNWGSYLSAAVLEAETVCVRQAASGTLAPALQTALDSELAFLQALCGLTLDELLTAAGYKQEDIKGFADLKKVAEDITARKDELGFAAFTSAGMDSSSDWRFKTHLANLPIYFEYQADGIGSTDAIKGTYLDNYKNMFDLYINNSTCAPTELAGKTGDDSRNEFLDNEAVFYQNGSWEYTNLVGDGKPFTDDDLTMIPVYIGVGDEANQGLCTGTENYWCVNKEADQADIDATLDFMYWCVSSDEGTKAMANDMGFVIPFKNAQESPNLFVKVDNALTAEGKTPVAWCFSTMPSENWKNGVGSALTAYAAGTGDWNAVVTAFVDGWKTEAALNAG